MPILNALVAMLAWIGRQGTRALAASIFLGLAVPQLAVYVKPYLGETVFVLLLFSYLRTDPAAFRGYLRKPGLAIAGALWVMIAVPLIFGALYAVSGAKPLVPDLYSVLILQVAIAPITSSAAFAALMGLDVALSLLTLIITSAISPISTVAFSYLFLGTSLFSPLDLGLKLFFFYAAAGGSAYIIRRFAGQAWIERQKQPIDGLNVIGLFVFAIVAMESVPRNVIADPLFALALFGFIVALASVLVGLSVLVFWRQGAGVGMVIGLTAAFRNLGVIMAAIGSTMPDVVWFYFALVQVPIYILPGLLKPLARRLHKPSAR